MIAREWRALEPVRAWCEARGVPVQTADDELPHFWRLRPTQQLLARLRASAERLVRGSALAARLDGKAADPWSALLAEAVEQYALETGDAELPLEHFVEYLVDWGREARRRQTGLLLTTAHRAKGLEFDHVVVVDGGWQRTDEDLDTQRRLLYVAATRARQTLALVGGFGSARTWAALRDRPAVLVRTVAVDEAVLHDPVLQLRRARAGLRDVDLGWAGRHTPENPCHAAIARLAVGDPLRVEGSGGNRLLLDARTDAPVGRLAQAFQLLADHELSRCSVAAVLRWSRALTPPEYAASVRCDDWEVVLPEFVFAPRGLR